jgi:hypothetical protein
MYRKSKQNQKNTAIPVANQFASPKRKEAVGYHHF